MASMLTVYQYSNLLYEALKADKIATPYTTSRDPPLMNLCVEMALFITNPNESKYDHDYALSFNHYFQILNDFCIDSITEIIVQFVVDTNISSYLKWHQFSDKTANYKYYNRQLKYSCNDNIVEFVDSSTDYINIRSDQILHSTLCYFINVFIFNKNDEMVIGIAEKDSYLPDFFPPYAPKSLTYSGGQEGYIKSHGGSKEDPCHGWSFSCNHGSIRHNGKSVKHPLNAYSAGDWINFELDFPNKVIQIYKNGQLEYESDGNLEIFKEYFFWFCVDQDTDRLLIEQSTPFDFVQFAK